MGNSKEDNIFSYHKITFLPPISNFGIKGRLQDFNVQDLCDLLVDRQFELLTLMDKRDSDGCKIRDLKKEVEKIQSEEEKNV